MKTTCESDKRKSGRSRPYSVMGEEKEMKKMISWNNLSFPLLTVIKYKSLDFSKS